MNKILVFLRFMADREDERNEPTRASNLRFIAEELARLQAIVDKLPKTKDGVTVFWGDRVWRIMLGEPRAFPVIVITNGDWMADLDFGLCEPVRLCYSTREALEAAEAARKETGG